MKQLPNRWRLDGEKSKEPVRYTGCGLDDIWLVSGYDLNTVDGERTISVRDLDGLHVAIGRSLVQRKKLLSGKEIRFLRKQMDLTQSKLARLVGCDAQQIARYEKGQNKMSGANDRILRMLYREHLRDQTSIRDILEALDELDGRIDDRQVFTDDPETGWRNAA
jgi:DNA-binding transcriptional regulator YiaG